MINHELKIYVKYTIIYFFSKIIYINRKFQLPNSLNFFFQMFNNKIS